ncbi:MAG: tetratricopeptide repeat protein [Leptolyngbyaceae cyanobacterium MO_188.B28]|nr:tetratricopeptide repeat protein [Leptolyngbyaceae cyanobacterium MO_188.B28]
MLEPIYSPIVFVGREQELAWLTQMMQASLTDSAAKWILSIQAPGGMGKTQLLKQFAEASQKNRQANGHTVLITKPPIDLYLTSHQTELGILRSIAAQLTVASGKKPFQAFFAALDRSFRASEKEVDLRGIFLDCYRTVEADQVVLLFDTIECASQAVQRFFQEMLPQLKLRDQGECGSLIVTAGRKLLTDYFEHPSIDALELKGLSQSEIRQYFEAAFPTPQKSPISSDFIDRITKLSRGRPILVALTIDWLNNGSSPKELDAATPKAFERMMIERISELRYPEDQTILAMAQLKRRFDDCFLVEVLGESIEKAQELLESVSRFSFVKSHYSADGRLQSCVLHDEMQRLVYTYVWKSYDPDNRLRKEWSNRAAVYYDKLLATEQNLLFRQNLQLEQLYYTFYVDKDQGLGAWRKLLQQANNQANPNDFKEALNETVKGFEQQLTREEKHELGLEWAHLAYARGRYREALDGYKKIIKGSPSRMIQSQVWAKLAFTYAQLDDFASGIKIGQEGQTWFQANLQSPDCNPWEQQQLLQDSGNTLNAVGWAYRQKGEFEQAIPYYEESLDVLKDVQAANLDRASTKTNLAFMYHTVGKNREAIAHGKSALKISTRQGDLRQLGLTHNVLGIIATNSLQTQEAVKHFSSALNVFSEIDYARGFVLVNIAYGRFFRQTGWYKVNPDRTHFSAAQADYAKAMSMFDQAIEQVQQSSQAFLMELYNEKGTLLREQSQLAEAIHFYQESQAIAENLENSIWLIDNLQDRGVAHYLQGDLEQAQTVSNQAKELAAQHPSPHLLGRAQRTLANILFQQEQYEQSLETALQSCINILELDQYSPNNSPAMRELLIEEWLSWLTEDLLDALEDIDLKKKQCEYLIKRWEEAEANNRSLSNHYPGFIITLNDLLLEANS